MPAIITSKHRTWRALKLKQESSLYLGIGKTSNWTAEPTPDTPLVSDTEITELQYIKKLVTKIVVKQDSTNGTLEVGGLLYKIVDDADVWTEEAMSLYLATTIDYSSAASTSISYRQIGVLLDPEYSGGVCTAGEYQGPGTYLGLDEVTDQGQLMYLDNREVITRTDEQSEKIEIIISF